MSTKNKPGVRCVRDQPLYNPTPEEIAAACLEIQKEWTAWERYRRSGGQEFKWPAPTREARIDQDAMREASE